MLHPKNDPRYTMSIRDMWLAQNPPKIYGSTMFDIITKIFKKIKNLFNL